MNSILKGIQNFPNQKREEVDFKNLKELQSWLQDDLLNILFKFDKDNFFDFNYFIPGNRARMTVRRYKQISNGEENTKNLVPKFNYFGYKGHNIEFDHNYEQN